MYSNICENTKCFYNSETKFCNKNKKKSRSSKQDHLCFCNPESGRCIKKLDNLSKNKINRRESIDVNGLSLTSIKLMEGFLEGFGWTYLKNLNKCYPLPPSSGLTYGILKTNTSFIVYNSNFYYYPIERIDNDLVIYLNNYKILIKSLKKCRLISSRNYE